MENSDLSNDSSRYELHLEKGGDEHMATAGAMVPIMAAAAHTSSYRVKLQRKEFLELVDIAKPKIIYRHPRIHFFAFDGFVMYTFECEDRDFKQQIIEVIEFSNQTWTA
jgi:hypothetical protein